MKHFAIFCIMATLICNQHLYADTIILRDGLQPIRGAILSGGTTGLRVELLDGPRETRLIPWSGILKIESSRPHPSLEFFLQEGSELYRAKQRMLRGDVLLAEPLFSESFARLVGTDGEDTRLAAEGLLRCAVARGDFSTAVHPWLETVRLDEMNITEPFMSLEPILDSSTMLCPHLPPVWRNDQTLAQVCEEYRTLPQPITAAIAALLISKETELNPIDGIEDPLFLWQIVQSANGNTVARSNLLARQIALPPWKRAWSDYFLADGYLAESNSKTRTTALIHLAKVASMNPKLQPWLTCASMLRLSDEMKNDGVEEASQRIRDEALRLYPVHPLHAQDPYQIRSSIQ